MTAQHLAEVGRPLDLVYYKPFCLVSDFASRVWLSKFFGSLAWIASAVMMAGVLARGARIPRTVAVGVGANVAACPVFVLLGEFSLWMYTSAVFLFWVGWSILVYLPRLPVRSALFLRLPALAVFFLSFNLNSLLVLFYSVCILLMLVRLRGIGFRRFPERALSLALRKCDFLLLPVLFWIWRSLFCPKSGPYVGYNTLDFAPGKLWVGAGEAYRQLLLPWAEGILEPSGWIYVAALVCLVFGWFQRRSRANETVSARPPVGMFFAGIFLLLAAVFPYLAVGQIPSAEGWSSRNAILTPLPLALALTSSFVFLSRRIWPGSPNAWQLVAAAWIVLSTGQCIRNYLSLQGLGAKHETISRRINEIIAGDPPALIQLRDYFRLPGTIDSYPPGIWTLLPTKGSIDPKTFVIETVASAPDQARSDDAGRVMYEPVWFAVSGKGLADAIEATTLAHTMEGIPRQGRHVGLLVRPVRQDGDAAKLGLDYLWTKWFDRTQMNRFLASIATSEFGELPPVTE